MEPNSLTASYIIADSTKVTGILRELKEYDVIYDVDFQEDGTVMVTCYSMNLGQQNIVSANSKHMKKI